MDKLEKAKKEVMNKSEELSECIQSLGLPTEKHMGLMKKILEYKDSLKKYNKIKYKGSEK